MNADPAIRQAPAGGNRLDTAIEWASGATAVGMFAYGYALSYSVLYSIATAVGLPPWAARVWPLGFESFMASAALNALAEQRHRRHLEAWWQRVPWYPWTLTGLTAGASLLLNWFHPAIPLDPPPGWLRSVVYGLPPLAAVFAWHLFLQRVTHRQPRPAAPNACPDTPAGTTVARLDTPPGPGTSEPAVDSERVRALSAPDTPPAQPSTPDRLPVRASAAATQTDMPEPTPDHPGEQVDVLPVHRVDAAGVQPGAVSTPPAGGVRDRLAAAYAAGRPDGAGWTARTLAAAAACGRSTAAAFLRQQRHARPEAGSQGVAR